MSFNADVAAGDPFQILLFCRLGARDCRGCPDKTDVRTFVRRQSRERKNGYGGCPCGVTRSVSTGVVFLEYCVTF